MTAFRPGQALNPTGEEWDPVRNISRADVIYVFQNHTLQSLEIDPGTSKNMRNNKHAKTIVSLPFSEVAPLNAARDVIKLIELDNVDDPELTPLFRDPRKPPFVQSRDLPRVD